MWFRKGAKANNGNVPIDVEFTPEEQKAISEHFQRFGTIASADAPPGTRLAMPQKALDGMVAQALVEYATECYERSGQQDALKAAKALMKAWAAHNLPEYIFQAALMLDRAGDQRGANEFYRLFVSQQESFAPDDVDKLFLDFGTVNVPEAVRFANTRIQQLGS